MAPLFFLQLVELDNNKKIEASYMFSVAHINIMNAFNALKTKQILHCFN